MLVGWCSYDRDEDNRKDLPYCALSSQPSQECPLFKEGGLVVEFDLDEKTIDFMLSE